MQKDLNIAQEDSNVIRSDIAFSKRVTYLEPELNKDDYKYGVNLAAIGSVTVSHTGKTTGHGPELARDSKFDTYFRATDQGMQHNSWTVEFGQLSTINKINVIASDRFKSTVRVQILDGDDMEVAEMLIPSGTKEKDYNPGAVVGKSVRISAFQNILGLKEVKVLGFPTVTPNAGFPPKNVAREKGAIAYFGETTKPVKGRGASNAIDDVIDVYSEYHDSLTEQRKKPSVWALQLAKPYVIEKIVIWMRGKHQDYNNNGEVLVKCKKEDNAYHWQSLGKIKKAQRFEISDTPSEPVIEVQIKSLNNKRLGFMEVQVFGE